MTNPEPDILHRDVPIADQLAAVQEDNKLDRLRDQILEGVRQDKEIEHESRIRFELVKLVLENDPEPLTSSEVITSVEALYKYVTLGIVPVGST